MNSLKPTKSEFYVGQWRVLPGLNRLERPIEHNARLSDAPSLQVIEKQLTPKVMRLCQLLAERPGETFSINEIAEQVWPDRVVSDSSVYQAVAQLRKALKFEDEQQEYIERVSGKGYRLQVEVVRSELPQSEHSNYSTLKPESSTDQKSAELAYKKPLFYAAIAALMGLLLSGWWWLSAEQNRLEQNGVDTESISDFSSVLSDKDFDNYTLAQHMLRKRSAESLLKAESLYKKVLANHPHHFASLLGVCHAYIYSTVYGDIAYSQAQNKCLPYLKQASQINLTPSEKGQLMATQAFIDSWSGNFQQAKLQLENALSLTPDLAYIHHWYGILLRKNNQFRQALSAHRSAYQLAPDDPYIMRGLAYGYLLTRELKMARHYFNRALLVEPHYTDAALDSLNFLPLNKVRAKAYLQWKTKYAHQQRAKRAEGLSHALVLLGLGLTDRAKQYLSAVDTSQVNSGYVLYTQAAFAMATGDSVKAESLLKQRYELASDINRYLMPYLGVLVVNGKSQLAEQLFFKHYPELSHNSQVTQENFDELVTLAHLFQLNQKQDKLFILIERLKTYENQQALDLSWFAEMRWAQLSQSPKQIKSLIESLLNQGWLPDFNDNMFSEYFITDAYSRAGGKEQQLIHLLQQNRQDVLVNIQQ